MKIILQVAFLLCSVVTFQCEGVFVNPNVVKRGGWGLLEVPYNNTSIDNFIIDSGYYGLQQFSQHIKQVLVTDENSIAGINERDEKLVIVTVNPSNSTDVTQEFDLSLFDSLGSVSLFRTSPTEQHVNLPPASISEKKVAIQLPALSISTLEISDVQMSTKANLIENGGFESVYEHDGLLYPTAWNAAGYLSNEGAVTQTNVWQGNYSGHFTWWQYGASYMSQDFVVSSDSPCELYLSAWCLSVGPNTKLGVAVNGVQGPEHTIASSYSNGTFSSYSFSFAANPSDSVQVYFKNTDFTLSRGHASIDDVVVNAVCGDAAEKNN